METRDKGHFSGWSAIKHSGVGSQRKLGTSSKPIISKVVKKRENHNSDSTHLAHVLMHMVSSLG